LFHDLLSGELKLGVLLEIKAGPFAGRKVSIAGGQSVTFGRAAGRAQFALPHDTFMSSVHFAVECGPQGCRIQDRKSSNGTFLNGGRIQDAMLANGDEIKSGQTIFSVRVVADAKLASLMTSQEAGPPSDHEPVSRAAESVPSSTPAARHPAAEPAPPRDPLAALLVEELKPTPVKAAPELAPPSHAPEAEPPPQFMRAADASQEAAEPHPVPDAVIGSPPRRSSETGLPSQNLPPKPVVSAKSAPPLEEPPRFHAIPSPPGAGPKPPGGGEPPPGVAPHIAQKFRDLPGSRGGVSPRGAAFSVMGWSFPPAPAEWQVQEGFGLQQSGHEEFPSSVAATEELLGGITLQQFVESQISMLRNYLRNPKIEPTMPPSVGGADESMAMDVRHSTKDGRELIYRRIYARSGSSVGVLTVTTLAADFPQVLETLQPLLEGAAFRATVNN
jgi:pSer/pThr/pTyr-binding forkhead associated (FHA) protein